MIADITAAVNAAISYGEQLKINPVQYKGWKDGESTEGNKGPFWAGCGPMPSIEKVIEEKCSCAGLVNLMCREAGFQPPANPAAAIYPGGTDAWTRYVKRLAIQHRRSFALHQHQPVVRGMLYLRGFEFARFENPQGLPEVFKEDAGHLAVGVDDENVLHCYPYTGEGKNGKSPHGDSESSAVRKDKFRDIDGWKPGGGYFEYAIPPEFWLLGLNRSR